MALDVKVFCKISDYLNQAYPAVARLLQATCHEGTLGTRGKPGTTFLVPKDPDVISKLEKLAQSSKVEDVDLAGNTLAMLIVRDHFVTGADWKSKEPVTALEQVLEVESASGSTVTFKNGAKAVLDTKFIDGSKKKNLSVWLLTGEIPTEGPAPSGKKSKTGSYQQSEEEADSIRNKIMLVVENSFAEYLRDKSDNTCDPFTAHLFSLIDYLRYNVDDKNLLYKSVIPLLCTDKVELYFLIEPHKPINGTYLIGTEIITDWWRKKSFDAAPMAVCAELEQSILHPEVADESIFYSDRATLLATISSLRARLLSSAEARPRVIADQIQKQYNDLANTNSIGGGAKIFPEPLAAYYKMYPGLKMAQDELRFTTHWKFAELCACRGRDVDLADLDRLFNMIGEVLYTCYAGNGKSALRLLNSDTLKYSITPTEIVEEIKCFVHSTASFHVAMTAEEYKRLSPKSSADRPKSSKILYNIAADVQQSHQRLTDYRTKDSVVGRLEKFLNIDVEALPEALREQLRKKFS